MIYLDICQKASDEDYTIAIDRQHHIEMLYDSDDDIGSQGPSQTFIYPEDLDAIIKRRLEEERFYAHFYSKNGFDFRLPTLPVVEKKKERYKPLPHLPNIEYEDF